MDTKKVDSRQHPIQPESDLVAGHLDLLKEYLYAKRYSPETIRHYVTAARAFFCWLANHHLSASNVNKAVSRRYVSSLGRAATSSTRKFRLTSQPRSVHYKNLLLPVKMFHSLRQAIRCWRFWHHFNSNNARVSIMPGTPNSPQSVCSSKSLVLDYRIVRIMRSKSVGRLHYLVGNGVTIVI